MLSADQTTPTDVRLKLKDQELQITWADGKVSVFSLPYLRGKCPCAACRTEQEQRQKAVLPILSTRPTEDLRAVDGWPVGNYAIQIIWSDGHNTGIFDFRYLRGLDENAEQ
jgi:DUF971 family protein